LWYAARLVRRNPAFIAVAAITLAFGIGGNTDIFTMVDAVALRSLPYRDAGQLMAIETRNVRQPELEPWTSSLDLRDMRARRGAFSAMAGISPVWKVVLTGRGESEPTAVSHLAWQTTARAIRRFHSCIIRTCRSLRGTNRRALSTRPGRMGSMARLGTRSP
jgi:hypothetical protein